MGGLPLRSSHFYYCLSCFSTSGDKQKNGALPRILSEFRFLNHCVDLRIASPVRSPDSARRARLPRGVRGTAGSARPEPPGAVCRKPLLPGAARWERARPGGPGCPLGHPRLPDGKRPYPPPADGQGLFLCARGALFIAISMPTHKRLKKQVMDLNT